MASTTLKADPVALKAGAKKIRSCLTEYEKLYCQLLASLDELDIDDTQKKALTAAASSMKAQFNAMKIYMENGIVELIETAAEAYTAADNDSLIKSVASNASSIAASVVKG